MLVSILARPIHLDYVDAPVVGFAHRSALVNLPLTTLACWYCGDDVSADNVDHASRVDGNSCHGYEPCHNWCADANKADIADAADADALAQELRDADAADTEFWADVAADAVSDAAYVESLG